MVDELAQTLDALIVIIDSCVNELLQVLKPRFRLVSVLRLERVLVAGIENCGLDDI